MQLRKDRHGSGFLQEVGWLAQVWAQSSLGTRVLGSLVEEWFQLLLDPAEKREKQAFSFPSEYCQGGAGVRTLPTTFGF